MTSIGIESCSDGGVVLWMDAPSQRVNRVSRGFWREMEGICQKLAVQRPRHVIIASSKPKSFIVGTDLQEIQQMSDADLDDYIAEGQHVLQLLEDLPFMTVAAINGDCIAGGLELAMACKARVCADELSIRVGLPQSTMGLVPCWGGTVRLRRLVGLEEAIRIVVGGELINPSSAFRIGLVNQVVAPDQLMAAASAMHEQRPKKDNAMNPRRIFEWADVQARNTFHGEDLVAPLKVLQIERDGMMHGEARELNEEREAFIQLRRLPVTQQHLREYAAQQSG